MKRLYLVVLALILTLGMGQAQGAFVTLNVLDDNITLGEAFDVEVWVDGEDSGEALLAFGFDVLTPGTIFSYTGYTVESGFADMPDPFNPDNVAGVGLDLTDDLLLATLSFSADMVGTDSLSVEGPYDGFFYGLFYEISGFDILASTDITVNQAAVPEPSSMFLMAIGLIGIGFAGRRRLVLPTGISGE
jgi:hypothetical protein